MTVVGLVGLHLLNDETRPELRNMKLAGLSEEVHDTYMPNDGFQYPRPKSFASKTLGQSKL